MPIIEDSFELLDRFDLKPFQERFPWFGGDLQTLRDTFVKDKLPKDIGKPIKIFVPEIPSRFAGSGHLLAFLDLPEEPKKMRGLVLMLHGLGGSSRRRGLRRMSVAFLKADLAVLRLNLRGADPTRHLVAGTYAAECNSDLLPVINSARNLCESFEKEISTQMKLPLYAVGLSLGGTILLNACLANSSAKFTNKKLFDGIACISSPLDLQECSFCIERPRNSFYQRWILQRLVRQTLEDPFGFHEKEKDIFKKLKSSNGKFIKNIRQFDSFITAPRWGFLNVDSYYKKASPFFKIIENLESLPSTLLVQSLDDPWVPANAFIKLRNQIYARGSVNKIEFFLSEKGGHNGFHDVEGCWGDRLVTKWLSSI